MSKADQDTNPRTDIRRIGAFELDEVTAELRSDGQAVPVPPLVFKILCYLVHHNDRVVTKSELLDELWGHRFVSESALTARIKTARKVLGDTGKSQHMIRTVRGRGYRFVGPVKTASSPAGLAGRTPSVAIRFAVGQGGLRLAIGQSGSGRPLLKVANWLTQVDKDADSPIWGHWVRDLSRNHRFIRYDARGCGLSDRNLAGIPLNDLDLWVDDLARVADSLDLDRVALSSSIESDRV